MHDNDELMKKIADTYIERYGHELNVELDWLEQFPGTTISEIRLEQCVREQIAAKKRRPYYLGALSVLAACFVIALLLLVPGLHNSDVLYSIDRPPTDPSSGLASPPHSAIPPDDSAFGQPDFEVIPLSASLPHGFNQIGFEQDYGKSIYFIEDQHLDNVVIILERPDALPDTSDLVEIDLGGLIAFGTQTDAYSLLTFSLDDVLYTLTSKHDINTLIRLGEVFA